MSAVAHGAVASRPKPTRTRSEGLLIDAGMVSEELRRASVPGAQTAVLELERGWPMPKVPLMLRFRNSRLVGECGQWWTLHVVADGRLPYPLRLGLRRRRATYLSGLGAVVQTFPDDLLLSGVGEAVDSAAALPVITASLSAGEGPFVALTARKLTYKPSRRLMVRYRLHRPSGRCTTLFGKCFPRGADDQIVAVLEALRRTAKKDRPISLRLPRLVGRVEDWNMLLWRRQAGVSVHDLLESDGVGEAVAIAGRCLGELHGSSVDWPRIHDRSREIATLRSWVRAVATADVVRGGLLYSTLQRLTDWEPGEGEMVPSHRDFYDKQLLIDGRLGGLLDFETSSWAEPELDAANFLAHLELRDLQGRRLGASGLKERFVDGYADRRRRLSGERLRWYRASTLLRLACVYFFRRQSLELSSRLHAVAQQVIGEARHTVN